MRDTALTVKTNLGIKQLFELGGVIAKPIHPLCRVGIKLIRPHQHIAYIFQGISLSVVSLVAVIHSLGTRIV
jgi:hypothetical protein